MHCKCSILILVAKRLQHFINSNDYLWNRVDCLFRTCRWVMLGHFNFSIKCKVYRNSGIIEPETNRNKAKFNKMLPRKWVIFIWRNLQFQLMQCDFVICLCRRRDMFAGYSRYSRSRGILGYARSIHENWWRFSSRIRR